MLLFRCFCHLLPLSLPFVLVVLFFALLWVASPVSSSSCYLSACFLCGSCSFSYFFSYSLLCLNSSPSSAIQFSSYGISVIGFSLSSVFSPRCSLHGRVVCIPLIRTLACVVSRSFWCLGLLVLYYVRQAVHLRLSSLTSLCCRGRLLPFGASYYLVMRRQVSIPECPSIPCIK